MSNNKQTPMQELLERVQEYRDSETSLLVTSRLNSICVDIIGILNKEKEVIEYAYSAGYHDAERADNGYDNYNLFYYNETYGGNK